MKDLIERLRGLNAEHPPFGAAHEAADALEQQAAVIEQMREALNISSAAVKLAGWEGDFAYTNAKAAELLQPCPEVLNKARAEAAMAAIEWVWSKGSVIPKEAYSYVKRIERGEA